MRRAREAILAHGGARGLVYSSIRPRSVRAGAVACDALDSARGDAHAEVGAVPHRKGFVLVARRHGSAVRAGCAQAEGAKSARDRHTRAFTKPPEQVNDYLKNPTGQVLGDMFLALDQVGRVFEPLLPRSVERYAIEKAVAFIRERLNGEDGWAASSRPWCMHSCASMRSAILGIILTSSGRGGHRQDDSVPGERGLLPAMPLSGLGYKSRAACVDGVRGAGGGSGCCIGVPVAFGSAGFERARRLGVKSPRSAARRMGVPVSQRLLPRCGRHGGGGDGAAPGGRNRLSGSRIARHGVGAGNAKQERRLGRIRRGQRALRTQQHSIRRSWSASRPADAA